MQWKPPHIGGPVTLWRLLALPHAWTVYDAGNVIIWEYGVAGSFEEARKLAEEALFHLLEQQQMQLIRRLAPQFLIVP